MSLSSRPSLRFLSIAFAGWSLLPGRAPLTAQSFQQLASFDPTKGQPVAALVEMAPGVYVGTAQTGGGSGWGSVFRLTSDGGGGWILEDLHAFSGPDGATPRGTLLAASDGYLYGTTYTGGANGIGIVYSGALFRIHPSGTDFALLHSFGGSDGARPVAGLIEATDGFFYGTTWGGGSSGLGTVYRTDATGAVTVLHSFTGSDGSRPAAALLEASDGYLYGATTAGGATGGGTLFRVSRSGEFLLLRSLTTADGTAPWAALVEAGGLLYGTTSAGGALGGGTIFGLSVGAGARLADSAFASRAAPTALSVLHDFAPAEGTAPYAALAAGAGGKFFGTTRLGGAAGRGTVYRVDTAGALTVLHSFVAAEGSSAEASLVEASDGRLIGTTRAGGTFDLGTVFAADSAGNLETLHSFGASGVDGAGPAAALVAASDGALYGTTSGGGRNNLGTAFRVAPTDGSVTSLHSFASAEGTRPYGGLVETPGGTFLGTTQMGGTYGTGSVFEMTAAGAVTLRHAFLFAEGTSPLAGLVRTSGGAFYGTTPQGGADHFGTVYRIDLPGTLTVVHSFVEEEGTTARAPLVVAPTGELYGTAATGGVGAAGTLFRIQGDALSGWLPFTGGNGAKPSAPLLLAADGLLYGVASSGGALGLGTLFRSNGVDSLVLLHSFSGPDGAYPLGGLVEGPDGALYGTTDSGGATDQGTVFRLGPPGSLSVVHAFQGSDGAHPRAGLTLGGDGSLYGTTFAGGARGAGTVFRLQFPLTVVIVPGGPTSFCAPGSVVLSAVPSGGSGSYSSYQWSRDGVALPGETAASYTATTSGAYTVTVTDSSGATSASSVAVVVTAAVAPTALVSGNTLISLGLSATLRAGLTGTPPWNLLWSDGASQSGIAASPALRTVSPTATTTYTVTSVTDANGCPGTASGSATVTVVNVALQGVVINPPSIRGPRTTTGNAVTLTGAAPAGGALVQLSSSNPVVASVNATVTVPAGAATATFPISAQAVSASTTVTITASWAGTTRTATLTVRP